MAHTVMIGSCTYVGGELFIHRAFRSLTNNAFHFFSISTLTLSFIILCRSF